MEVLNAKGSHMIVKSHNPVSSGFCEMGHPDRFLQAYTPPVALQLSFEEETIPIFVPLSFADHLYSRSSLQLRNIKRNL